MMLFGQTQTVEKSFVLPKGEKNHNYQYAIPLPAGKVADLVDIAFAKTNEDGAIEALGDDIQISSKDTKTTYAGTKPHFYLSFNVSREDDNSDVELQVSLEYRIRSRSNLELRSGPEEPLVSVLASGDIFKLAIDEDGIYQIDAAFLSSLGLPTTNPQQVRLYSKGGAALPELVGAPYPVDLQEVALFEVGNGDSSWDDGEKFLFYGQGEDVWVWDAGLTDFKRIENPYSEQTFYYLKIEGTGLRALSMPSAPSAPAFDRTYTNRVHWQEDLVNVLQFSSSRYGSGQGSGQQFFGYTFGTNREVSREALWDLGTIVPNATGKLTARLAASALNNGTRFSVSINGQTSTSPSITKGVRSDANSPFAHDQILRENLTLSDNIIDVNVAYPGTLESNPGWLDYVQLTYPCSLVVDSDALFFRSTSHTESGTYGFELNSSNQCWTG